MAGQQVTQADLAQLRREIAELRGHVARFKRALGASSIEEAELEIRRLRQTVSALDAWGKVVTPPFTPPAG